MNSQAEADPQGQREWDEQCEAAGRIARLAKENKELREALRASLNVIRWTLAQSEKELKSVLASPGYIAASKLAENGGGE